MNQEILGPGLNLCLYESPAGFNIPSLIADLGYFIREQGAEVIKQLLPQFPRELLTRLQYAPDNFSYHLIYGQLIASEDIKNRNFVDARSRVDLNEPERGFGAFRVLEKITDFLTDEKNCPDEKMVVWASPREGFSRHAYLNIGTIGRDDKNCRMLSVTSHMSDFSLGEIKRIIGHLTGLKLPETVNPRMLSGMLFPADTNDLIAACRAVLGRDRTIEGVPIEILYGSESKDIWRTITLVVGEGKEKIVEIVHAARGEVEKMQAGMAQTVFGFIESVLESIDVESKIGFVREKVKKITERDFMAAFMTAAVGCMGGLISIGSGGVVSSVGPVFGAESHRVHCPNCNKIVSCAVGESCPGCHQIRPC